MCDATGACTTYAPGTVCNPASCPTLTSTLTAASQCNASGQCVPGGTTDCAPFACDGVAACLATCNDQNDCAPGATCMSGTCQ
jgi:hypothetical protein